MKTNDSFAKNAAKLTRKRARITLADVSAKNRPVTTVYIAETGVRKSPLAVIAAFVKNIGAFLSPILQKILPVVRKKRFIVTASIIAAALVIVVVFVAVAGKGKRGSEVLYTVAVKEPVSIKLIGNGVLDSESSVNVIAPMVSRYRRLLIWLIPEGSVVRRGDVLARCDTSDMEKAAEDIRLDRGSLRAKYKDTEVAFQISIDELNARLENKKQNEKVSKLTFDSMAYAAELDRQKSLINLNQASADVEIAKSRISQEQNKRDVQLRQISNDIEDRSGKLEEMSNFIKRYTVYAPAEGLVVYPLVKVDGQERKIQVGDSLYYGQVFLTLPDLFHMIVKIEVGEEDIKKIVVGQKAEIVLEAYKDKKYTGYIYNVSNLAQVKLNNKYVKVFTVKIRINEQDLTRLKPGMNTMVTVFIREYPDAYTLPVEFIYGERDDTSVCVVSNRRVVRRHISVADYTADAAVLTNAFTERVILMTKENAPLLTASNFTIDTVTLTEYHAAR